MNPFEYIVLMMNKLDNKKREQYVDSINYVVLTLLANYVQNYFKRISEHSENIFWIRLHNRDTIYS